MNKFWSLLLGVLLVGGCVAKDESFKGKEYKMVDSETKTEIMLGFSKEDNSFFGKAVNNYFGTYNIKDDNINFDMGGSTMMLAPKPLMEMEAKYFKTLPELKKFSLNGTKLVLTTADGKELVFEEIVKAKK